MLEKTLKALWIAHGFSDQSQKSAIKKIIGSSNQVRNPVTKFLKVVRVCDLPKNDTQNSSSMQKQRAFYSAEVQHAGVSHYQDRETTK